MGAGYQGGRLHTVGDRQTVDVRVYDQLLDSFGESADEFEVRYCSVDDLYHGY